jgi:hypothetical protein
MSSLNSDLHHDRHMTRLPFAAHQVKQYQRLIHGPSVMAKLATPLVCENVCIWQRSSPDTQASCRRRAAPVLPRLSKKSIRSACLT